MNLEHLIQQLQEAHAKLGNHPNVKLTIDCWTATREVTEATEMCDDIYLDAAKQTVYLPVTVSEQH